MNLTKAKTFIYKNIIKTKNVFSETYFNYLFNDPLLIYYSDFTKNWGDYINPFLFNKITDREIVSEKRIYNFKKKEKIFGVGSILHHTSLANAVIWGSGFIHPVKVLKELPKEILALRGKYSAKIFNNNGLKDSGVYGDPALLFPTFYTPPKKKEFKLGIIPHYSELAYFLSNEKIRNNKEVLVISPFVKNNEVYEIIDQLNKCEVVISSSLHGLILADAYHIPSLRFTYSNTIFGGDFKYNDYYSGVGINSHPKLHLDDLDQIDFKKVVAEATIKDLKFSPDKISNALEEYISKNK